MVVVYGARKIITMDHNCPQATHVAVQDGRILAVGTAPETEAAEVQATFSEARRDSAEDAQADQDEAIANMVSEGGPDN